MTGPARTRERPAGSHSWDAGNLFNGANAVKMADEVVPDAKIRALLAVKVLPSFILTSRMNQVNCSIFGGFCPHRRTWGAPIAEPVSDFPGTAL